MTYGKFVDAVHSFTKNNKDITVECSSDSGKYYAHFSDGTEIVGYSDCHRLSVRFAKAQAQQAGGKATAPK